MRCRFTIGAWIVASGCAGGTSTFTSGASGVGEDGDSTAVATFGDPTSATQGDPTSSDADPTIATTSSDPSASTTSDDASDTSAAQTDSSTSGDAGESSTGPGCAESQWWVDGDGDGHGAGDPIEACDAPDGHVAQDGDCNDGALDVHPGADEVCDGVDQDCDGKRDEYSPSNASCGGCALDSRNDLDYAFCPQALVQGDAQAYCDATFATDLAQIDDGEENTYVRGYPAPPPENGSANYWIGINDLANEGQFVWIDGGAPAFTFWAAGEPNDYNLGEDCSEVYAGGEWNDIPCDYPHAFVCRG